MIKKWDEMNDENDELIERLNQLKPVEEQDLVMEEILKKEEEIELQKDKYFEERERQDRLRQRKVNRIKPVELDPDFELLNKDTNELLINSKRMKKQEFAKKLDIYLIVMKKKLIKPPQNTVKMK